MKHMHYKIKWYNIIIIILTTTLTITVINSIIKLFNWYRDSYRIKEQINSLQNIIINTNENSEEVNNNILTEKNDITNSNPYLEYQNIDLINVDFDELKSINSDIVGWFKVNGTDINYPFVQTSNNSYYLKHDLLKNYNTGGWLFLDYRNNIDELSKNNIIYGHNRKDKTMFGTLDNIYNKEWLNNKNNHFIQVSSTKYNFMFQVFSIYHIKKTNDYLKTSFKDDEFNNFITLITKRSLYNFNVLVSDSDKILTLSTCYKNNERTVLHAKLVSIIKK